MRAASALLVLATAACGRSEPAIGARAGDCRGAMGDSARAVCLAVAPRPPFTEPRHVFEVVRRGETICVHTGPGEPATDGEERVSVVRGRVVERIESDSTGCR